MYDGFTFNNIAVALALTLLAGMSTGIGSLMAFFTKADNKRFLSWALGLSAGVMIYVSFMEMLPQAIEKMHEAFSGKNGELCGLIGFFGGIGLIALIDLLVPEEQNPHEEHRMSDMATAPPSSSGLKRTGVMLALAIGIHNFPEGMATFISSLESWDLALPIVVAIAIHNIPEGIAVSVPIYHATGDRRKAFRYSLLSGLAEPVGALVGALFLLPFWTAALSGWVLAAVAGIMVYISFDELLPGAHQYGHHHLVIIGVIMGMAVMAVSLLMF
ncbi:MAG: zinc transporter ZupT [Muribaculaceae bacterium]|nr:zinc transporter ZupT [Muribaculaceae bacterium]